MGCIFSDNSPESVADKKISKALSEDSEKTKTDIHVLLLGTGGCGKSTFFKQMQIAYSDGEAKFDPELYRHTIRMNLITSAYQLGQAAQKFGYEFKNPESIEALDALALFSDESSQRWEPELAKHVQIIWEEEDACKKALLRRTEFQFLESAEYFAERLKEICSADYTPTQQDILRSRTKTTGMIKQTYIINDLNFVFLDVGGQRSERKKWVNWFGDVTVVIFMSAISEFNQYLEEDANVNSLFESLYLFKLICDHNSFQEMTIILFLNKYDRFQEKINEGQTIHCAFPTYQGPPRVDEQAFFIQDEFLARRDLDEGEDLTFPHLTTAIDPENVKKVFNVCKLTIIKENLKRLGLA